MCGKNYVMKYKKNKYVTCSPYKLIMGYEWSIKDERRKMIKPYKGWK